MRSFVVPPQDDSRSRLDDSRSRLDDSRPRIVILVGSLPSDMTGGMQVQAEGAARELGRAFDVVVISRAVRQPPGLERRDGYLVCRKPVLKWIPGVRFCFDLLVTLGYIFALRRNIAAFVGYQTLGAGIHAVIAGRLFKAPSLVLIRSEREYRDDLSNPIKRRLSRFTWSAASRIMLQTPRMRADFLSSTAARGLRREELAARTVVIPNGANMTTTCLAPDRPERAIVIGRLSPEKGVGVALEALRGMAAGDRPELLVIGDGPLRANLRTTADGLLVTFTGDVPHAKVLDYLAGGGILVLPSLREGMPNALIEAMAYGLPVVASAVGGVPDVIRDGENGLLVPPGNAAALRQAIARLQADAGLRHRLRTAARLTASAFSWEVLGQRLIQEVAVAASTVSSHVDDAPVLRY